MSLTSKNNEKIGAVNRGTPCESGLCNFCRTDCQGRCETWLSSLLGRRTLVPRDYGNATIGTENTTHVGVSYNALLHPGPASSAGPGSTRKRPARATRPIATPI